MKLPKTAYLKLLLSGHMDAMHVLHPCIVDIPLQALKIDSSSDVASLFKQKVRISFGDNDDNDVAEEEGSGFLLL